MGDAGFAGLPVAQREMVDAALRAAFGAAPIGEAVPLSGGASARPFRVAVNGRRYLVRVEGPESPLRNPQQYASMRIAAEAGIAPRIHHLDEAARVVVMDFIEAQPLDSFPGGPHALAAALGALLRRLQDGPAFPAFVSYPDIVARLFSHVRRTGLFAAGLLDPHVERLEMVTAAYTAGATPLVASHNDLIPANILFDGARLWLIDWESAYRNDPLVDVSTLSDSLATTPDLQETLLRSWLGRAPDGALIARLDSVRALTRLYYAGVFLSASAALTARRGDTDLTTPTPAAFRRMLAEGRLKPGTPAAKHILGKLFLAAFLDGADPPGFDAAV